MASQLQVETGQPKRRSEKDRNETGVMHRGTIFPSQLWCFGDNRDCCASLCVATRQADPSATMSVASPVEDTA